MKQYVYLHRQFSYCLQLNNKHVYRFIGFHVNGRIHWKFRCNILIATMMKAIIYHSIICNKITSTEAVKIATIRMHHCIQMLETLINILTSWSYNLCSINVHINDIDYNYHNT